MVHSIPSEPSPPPADSWPTRGDGTDLSVEPVAAHRGASPRAPLPPAARVERLRRLALELHVAVLQRDLARARERRAAVIEHYERVIDDREPSDNRPVFSWRRRD